MKESRFSQLAVGQLFIFNHDLSLFKSCPWVRGYDHVPTLRRGEDNTYVQLKNACVLENRKHPTGQSPDGIGIADPWCKVFVI